MKRKTTTYSSFLVKAKFRKLRQFLQKAAFGLCLTLGCWFVLTTITLVYASSQPADAFFVLGGSIWREIYAAQQAKQHPQTPILISHGSLDPCIWLIFQQEAPEFQKVWLEKCANSTFENFYYGVPILQRWGVHKVKLITSKTHLPRAKWIARIMLGAHGIWVEPDIIQEHGIPGNHEYGLKTGLDVGRSLVWAFFSQVIQPQCSNVTRLAQVDMSAWQHQGFNCERIGKNLPPNEWEKVLEN
jgi:uncharacterized SAM-binding protein YcdF (DUF218 family)